MRTAVANRWGNYKKIIAIMRVYLYTTSGIAA
jgi:hypothetical protein